MLEKRTPESFLSEVQQRNPPLYSVGMVAAILGLKPSSLYAGEWRGSNPADEEGATNDGFSLFELSGAAHDGKLGKAYTPWQVAGIARIDPYRYEPVAKETQESIRRQNEVEPHTEPGRFVKIGLPVPTPVEQSAQLLGALQDMAKAIQPQPPSSDPVRPVHYKVGDTYETIKVLESWLTPEELQGFCVGNTIKYLSRWKDKGGVTDLEKARWYLDLILAKLKV